MQQAQQYFAALLSEPAADSMDMRLNVADELLHLGHAEEVRHPQAMYVQDMPVSQLLGKLMLTVYMSNMCS